MTLVEIDTYFYDREKKCEFIMNMCADGRLTARQIRFGSLTHRYFEFDMENGWSVPRSSFDAEYVISTLMEMKEFVDARKRVARRRYRA